MILNVTAVQYKMNETTSVYQLISNLCSCLTKELDENDDRLSLNSAKQIAFQVLLKNNFGEIPDNEKLIQELQFTSFELTLANRISDSEEVNCFIEDNKEKWPIIEPTCWLLLHLKNIDPDPQKAKHQVIKLNSTLLTSISITFSVCLINRMNEIS